MNEEVKMQMVTLMVDTCKFLDGLHSNGTVSATGASLRDNLEKAAQVLAEYKLPEDKPKGKK